MQHILTVDLEDWFCSHNLRQVIAPADWEHCESRVTPDTLDLLQMLARHHARATFFVLGWVAERVPDLIRRIAAEGHEIAVHGYAHLVLTELSPAQFQADLERALDALARIVPTPIRGFRAPAFSVTARTLWALELLPQFGIAYDSSIFPLGHHPDYGIAAARLDIHAISETLVEAPVSCANVVGLRVPCGGGGYLRLFPYGLFRQLMQTCVRAGRPLVLYIHPWELDANLPRVAPSAMQRFRHYQNLNSTRRKLDALLSEYAFVPAGEFLQKNFAWEKTKWRDSSDPSKMLL